jgi:hypothetical protein
LRAFTFAVLLAPAVAAAQVSLGSPSLRGQVVEEASGAPLQGVTIVARWEFSEYRPSLHGSGYHDNGEVLHIAEAETGADGRFSIPGWGPKLKASGRMDERAPKLSLFKSGYAPLEVHVGGSKGLGQPLKLHTFAGAPKQYAEAIARFQGSMYGGLWWRHPSDQWKAMPRMILALHREKARLGEDGREVLGANSLHGRSGRGELRDRATGQPVQNAVIQVAWTLRREGGRETRRFVEQRRGGVESDAAQFYATPWRLPSPAPAGWEVVYEAPLLVRVYAPGYRASAEHKWDEAGGTIRLDRLPEAKEAVLAELRAWRRDADAELARGANREEALAGQQQLLRYLSDHCRTLTVDVHPGICLAADSEVERYVEQVRRTPRYTMETADGPRDVRIVASTARAQAVSPIQAQSVRSPGGAFGVAGAAAASPRIPGRIAPVGGFSIEPVQ